MNQKEEGQAEPKVQVDAFGTERTPEGAPVEPKPAPAAEKPEDNKPESKTEPKAEDIESNPLVKELRGTVEKLEKDKSSMGGNLSEQRKMIDKLNKRIEEIESGKAGAKTDPLFKDIKRVKDLPKDQAEAMTDAEKRLFDELADTRDAMNKVVADAQSQSSQAQTAAEKAEEEAAAKAAAEEAAEKAQEEFDEKVQGEAMRLAGGDKDMANRIIAEFNEFADNDKLSAKALVERVEKAAKLVDGYKPPREQRSPRGTAAGGSDADDKYGTQAIIDQVQKARTGGTYDL